MGLDTHGKLIGKVTVEEILNFLKQKYDNNATHNVKSRCIIPLEKVTWKYAPFSDSENYIVDDGYFSFNYYGRRRCLFYVYSNINSFENYDLYVEQGLKEMVDSETTFLSLGYDDDAVTIMKEIVTHFGGWIDENDCDDVPYYKIGKNEESIEPVKLVTMEEIYEKFGCVVSIIDKKSP